jgi:cytochrome c peroxidase
MRVCVALCLALLFVACNSTPGEGGRVNVVYRTDLADLRLPEPAFDYTPSLPSHFTDSTHELYRFIGYFDNMPDTNVTTDTGATLGRVLFYDTRLSANDTVSCASCHKQEKGFSDDAILSEGFQGGLTRRHSMGLANARYYKNGRFFWDERAETLEDQVLMPIQDAVEMGMSLNTLVGILAATQEYPVLFNEAFGSPEVTEEKIARALAQFVRSMISYQSKFDEGISIGWDNLTDAEFWGAKRFISLCGSCHQGVLQNGAAATNNGIDDITTDLDRGLNEVTGLEEDDGKFKIPSLRNIAVTAPYMHDGRMQTLSQVIDHYMTGVQPHANLDDRLKDGGSPQNFPLSQKQKDELIDFLETLTDHELLTDEKFSDPFN